MKWGLAAVGTAVILLLIVAWLMFQHIPSWYRPVIVTRDEVPRVVNEASQWEYELTEGLSQAKGPFEVHITPEQANRWVAVPENFENLWPRWLPRDLTDPCVIFEEGAMRLAATYRSGSLATVISVRLLVEGRKDWLWVTLDSVQFGSLPVPRQAIRERLERLDAGPWPAGRITKYQNLAEALPSLASLLDEARFPNSWIWPNGKWPFWITRLKVSADGIVAVVEPLPRSTTGR